MMRTCLYTVLTGGYEVFNEQPLVEKTGEIPFICFTDDTSLERPGWEFRPLKAIFPSDPVRSQREVKIRPHRYLPDFDASLYIDNSVLLKVPPQKIIERFQGSELSIPHHSFRRTVADEFAEVLKERLDDEGRILEQFDDYYRAKPEILRARPFWGGILMRQHHTAEMIEFADTWASHVNRYSRRDQLSVNFAMDVAGVAPTPMQIDNFNSWFHAWPRARNRNQNRRTHQAHNALERRRALLSELLEKAATSEKIELAICAHMVLTNRTLALNGITRRFETTQVACERAASHAVRSFVRCKNGRTIFVNPGDPKGRKLAEHDGNLNPDTLHLWNHLIGLERWTDVIDVGTNYGEMLVNVDLPEGARVVACECNDEILPYVESTLSRLPTPVKLLKKAVDSRVGVAEFLVDRNWSGTSRLVRKESDSGDRVGTRKVETTTLEAVLADSTREVSERRVLVKIDVEGFELEVLTGIGDDSKRFESLHLMIKTIHLPDPALDSLLMDHEMHLLELGTHRLLRVGCKSAAEYRKVLESKRFHARDAVLTRRPTGSDNRTG